MNLFQSHITSLCHKSKWFQSLCSTTFYGRIFKKRLSLELSKTVTWALIKQVDLQAWTLCSRGASVAAGGLWLGVRVHSHESTCNTGALVCIPPCAIVVYLSQLYKTNQQHYQYRAGKVHAFNSSKDGDIYY